MLRKRAPIGGDHHDVARSFLDAWLGELEFAAFRRLREDRPDRSSDELDVLSEVSDHDDGRWIWIAVEGSLKYVVAKRTGLIFEVNGLGINKRKCFGPVRFWDWNWPKFLTS
jgi:hypothetical protein